MNESYSTGGVQMAKEILSRCEQLPETISDLGCNGADGQSSPEAQEFLEQMRQRALELGW